MLDTHILRTKNHPDHIEPEGVSGLLESGHPDLGGTAELALLPPVDSAHGTAEISAGSSLHFDEGHGPFGPAWRETRRDEVDVTVAILESTLGDLPAVNAEPFLRDALALHSHRLACC